MEYQRFVAVEKEIKEIKPNEYGRVKIIGTIVNKNNTSFIIDDGTATAKVFLGTIEPEKFNEKDLVCVIGRISPTKEGLEIQAEIIKKLEGFDVKLYRRTQKLWRIINE